MGFCLEREAKKVKKTGLNSFFGNNEWPLRMAGNSTTVSFGNFPESLKKKELPIFFFL